MLARALSCRIFTGWPLTSAPHKSPSQKNRQMCSFSCVPPVLVKLMRQTLISRLRMLKRAIFPIRPTESLAATVSERTTKARLPGEVLRDTGNQYLALYFIWKEPRIGVRIGWCHILPKLSSGFAGRTRRPCYPMTKNRDRAGMVVYQVAGLFTILPLPRSMEDGNPRFAQEVQRKGLVLVGFRSQFNRCTSGFVWQGCMRRLLFPENDP